jgi:hypothetical protein
LEVVASGDRLVVRGPSDADQALVQAVLARKQELMPLLQREAEQAAVSASSPRVHPVSVRERRGNLIRVDGVEGWLSVRDLGPCGACGGTRFRIGRQRLFCPHCLAPRANERDAAEIELSAIQA